MRLICIVAAIAAVCPLGAGAAETDAEVAGEVAIDGVENVEDLALESLLERPVTGVSQYEQKPSEAPSAVSVITAEDIERFGYRTLAEALSAQRGIYATNDRNYTFIGLRGLGTPGDYNTRVLELVDGHRMNDTVFGTAYIGHEFPLELELIDRIEVIRGPSSSIYGSSAFLGVFNIVSASGATAPGLRARTGFEPSSKGVRTTVSYGKRWSDELDVLAGISYSDARGADSTYFPEFDNPDTTCVDASLNVVPCDGMVHGIDQESYGSLFLRAHVHGVTLRILASSRTKHVPTGSFDTTVGDPGFYTTDGRWTAALDWTRALSERTDISLSASYDRYLYWGEYPFDGRTGGAQSYAEARQIYVEDVDASWLGADARVTHRRKLSGPFESLTLVAGVDASRHLAVDYDAGYTVDGNLERAAVSLDGTETILGLYAQGEARLAGGLTLVGGLRFDDYLDSFGATLHPRLAAIWAPRRNLNLKLMYGTAFRAPSMYEARYGSTEPIIGGFMVNPDLGPESIETIEGVLEAFPVDDFRVAVAAYHYAVRDLIVATAIDDDHAQYENRNAVNADGVELEVEGKWGEIHGRASVTWQHAVDSETGGVLPNSPRSLFQMNISVPVLARRIYAGLDTHFVDARTSAYGATVPASMVHNVTLSSVPELLHGISFRLSLKNALDSATSAPGSEEHREGAIPQAGRALWFEVGGRL
jgi:outer membrane receptor for ferrienterochelin and colicins